MKPPNENGGSVSRATAHMITTSPKEVDEADASVKASGREEKPLVDRMSEIVRFLQSEWLRHDVLFRALRNEQDRLAALRLARFIDLIREAQNELLPPWLNGNELLALAREGRKGVRR
jgi:hypothetical protein